jgi:two-component system chemotaxis response regulator CheB
MPRAFELPAAPPLVAQAPTAHGCPIVAIGANAGGPAALRVLFRSCGRAATEAAWIVAQNGPTEMLLGLVPLLARETTMRVSLAGDGSPIEPGAVILAPGGSHVRVSGNGRSIELLREPPINHVRPSADVLFASAAAAAGGRCVAVVLTGMGCDGIEGAAHVRRARGRVVVVRPSARVASGMADGVVRSGYASALESLETVGAAVTDMVATLRPQQDVAAIAG